MADGTPGGLTHQNSAGEAHMVDTSAKPVTRRVARASGAVVTRTDVIALIAAGGLPKGEALATARIAGIMAAKRTPELVPLCHPLPISGVELELDAHDDRVDIVASVTTVGVTGVEMEALTAVSVAALTVYDMIKAVDRAAVITDVRVVEKRGGASGSWVR